MSLAKLPSSPSAGPMRCWPTSRRERSSNMAGSSPAKCWMDWAWPRQRRDRSSCGWVAFKGMSSGNQAMVMGDLVLLETEIKPVMTKLVEGGLDITAVHNHLLRANPATFYMHVGGHGDPAKMAVAIRTALSESKTPLAPPTPPAAAPAIDLDTVQLDQIIGGKGQANGGV